MYKNKSQGFTVVEVIVVIFVIAILSGAVLYGVGDSGARGRDTQRATDITALHNRLEEYFSDYGGYPNTFNADTFPSLDPEVLLDPHGTSIAIQLPASSYVAALQSANPTDNGPNYYYIPYPTGCTAITCTGYVLKSYIENPSEDTPNPFIKTGLSNN